MLTAIYMAFGKRTLNRYLYNFEFPYYYTLEYELHSIIGIIRHGSDSLCHPTGLSSINIMPRCV